MYKPVVSQRISLAMKPQVFLLRACSTIISAANENHYKH
ncbi:MAG: hypothetical protein PWP38_742 [Clostridiales bacterium]|nr:hypothetical protein [Clostridiales bacterium]